MKILVAGWFSFEQMGATAGDLYSKDVVCQWLDDANMDYDVALEAPFQGGVNWRNVDPNQYSHAVFVCGPFGNGWPVTDFLDYFTDVKLVGINLSMLQTLEEWNPFDLLLERDSSRRKHPDLVFLSKRPHVPVVGLVLVEPQKEYGNKADHAVANKAISEFLASQHCSIVSIDTRLDVPNRGGLRTPEEIESLVARMDMVITTRLHGMVLALKNGVPALAIDAIKGGAKITKQANAINWPNLYVVDQLNERKILEGYQYCFTKEAKAKALECRELAIESLDKYEQTFIGFLEGHNSRFL